MRILLDYRPALRERTGVGEYVHELARELATGPAFRRHHDELAILSTSWKDRPSSSLASALPGVEIVDRRIPVRPLAWAWNRLEWPPVEWLAGRADVVHAQTPLLIPARHAAQIITVHDLDFLKRPDRTHAEMRRDFPALVRAHAQRADHVIVSSEYGAGEVMRELAVPRERLTVCAAGAPLWAAAVLQQRRDADDLGSSILFVGTVDERKNVAGLLQAYSQLRGRRRTAPPLVIAGRVRPSAAAIMERARDNSLLGAVDFRGYVADRDRPALYRHARMLVLPSFEEGFGLPVLEAMACGVPVVISNRGSLPEVAGDAATPVEPDDTEGLARQMEVLLEDGAARERGARAVQQAARFSWQRCAQSAVHAYYAAVAHRNGRRR